MENSILDNELTSNSTMGLSPRSLSFLKESAKWGKFLGIVGFIASGLIVLIALFSIFTSGMRGGYNMVSGFVTLLMCLIYFMPSLYLYTFSVKTKQAIELGRENDLEKGLENLKKMFKFSGIFTAVILSIYLLILIFGTGAGVFYNI